jgi:hypothetical protein
MERETDDRWEWARGEVIRRWRAILRKVAERDEGGALALANVMDEFCEEAIAARDAAVGPGAAGSAVPTPLGAAIRCQFCRGFTELGGCFGLLNQFNQAVLGRRWELAQRLVEGYIERLESTDLGDLNGRRVH